jgi:hypothetical protein
MFRSIVSAIVTMLTTGLLAAPAATLKYDSPAGWVNKPPASTMHVVDFVLPKVAGDPEDAQLTIYYFGGQGGTVQANLDRWIGQMNQPNGKPSKDVAKTSTMESHGLKVTMVDVSGTYVAAMTPGGTDNVNKPNFRLRAAVVETSNGPYFVKLTGPEKTVTKWDASYTAFVKSIQLQ